jgi:opacity protein-like surface antigen
MKFFLALFLSVFSSLSFSQLQSDTTSRHSPWNGPYVSASYGVLDKQSEVYTNNLYNGYNSPYTNSLDSNQSSAGIQLGYLWAFNSYILGIEADFNPATLKNSECRASMYPDPPCKAWEGYLNVSTETKYQGSLRMKMGYVFSDFMFYVTGGFSAAKISSTLDVQCPYGCGLSDDSAYTGSKTISQNKLLATYGVGGEYMFDKHWRLGADYLFFKSPSQSQSLIHSGAGYGPQIITSRTSNKYELLRLRLIYAF